VQSHRRQGLLGYFRLLLKLRRVRPDVVISSWAQDNILATLAFLGSGARTVLVEHSSWNFHTWPIRLLRRIVYPLASHVVVLNRRDLEHYGRYLGNVRLIPDPVPAPGAESRRPREKLIIAIGHLTPLKNFEDAVRAMALSRLEEHGWSLAIVGSGTAEPQLHQLISDLGLTHTHVHSSRQDLASWYARASLLVLPSRLESFSLVLAEAMLCGVVPIAYATDGPSFILEDFADHLVDVGDVHRLAERLVRFANDPGLDALRRVLCSSIEFRFSPDAVLDQWKALLEPPACE
jgi:glycosyltransferase involved in cell wall biosynthesis